MLASDDPREVFAYRDGSVSGCLLIAILVLLILGAAASPVIRSLASAEQLASNVLLGAIPFILIFAAIVLTFVGVIAMVSGMLSGSISARIYRPIEFVLIAGIVLGVVGMFQPWLFIFFKAGFFVLLVSTLGFILWSRVTPKVESRQVSVQVV